MAWLSARFAYIINGGKRRIGHAQRVIGNNPGAGANPDSDSGVEALS